MDPSRLTDDVHDQEAGSLNMLRVLRETIRGVFWKKFTGWGTFAGSGAEHFLPEIGEHASKLIGDHGSLGGTRGLCSSSLVSSSSRSSLPLSLTL